MTVRKRKAMRKRAALLIAASALAMAVVVSWRIGHLPAIFAQKAPIPAPVAAPAYAAADDQGALIQAPVEALPAPPRQESITDEARKMIQEVGEQKADSDVVLGTMYLTGRFGRQDAAEALKWIGRAADAGNPYALYLRLRMREEKLALSNEAEDRSDFIRLAGLAEGDGYLTEKLKSLATRMGEGDKVLGGIVLTPVPVSPAGKAEEHPSVAQVPSAGGTADAARLDGLSNGLLAAIDKAEADHGSAGGQAPHASLPVPPSAPTQQPASQDATAATAAPPVVTAVSKADIPDTGYVAPSIRFDADEAGRPPQALPPQQPEAAASKPVLQDLPKEKPAQADPVPAKKAPVLPKALPAVAQPASNKERAQSQQNDPVGEDADAVPEAPEKATMAAVARNARAKPMQAVATAAASVAAAKPPKAGEEAVVPPKAPADAVPAADEARNKAAQAILEARKQAIGGDATSPGQPSSSAVTPDPKPGLTAIDAKPAEGMSEFQKMVAQAQAERGKSQDGAPSAKDEGAKASSMVNSAGQVLQEIPQASPAAAKANLSSQVASAAAGNADGTDAVGRPPALGMLYVLKSQDGGALLRKFYEVRKENGDALSGLDPSVDQVQSKSGMVFVLGVTGFSSQRQMDAVCAIFNVKSCKGQ